MKEKVLKYINENSMVKDKDRVLVALSGGPDSVCLLHILYRLKETLNIELYAAHVNHCLRGESALADEEYSKNLCDNLGINLFVKRVDIAQFAKDKGISTEMAGREARYDFFDKLKKELHINKIAIAHNANDQAETLIMRALRGTGIEGLVGIRPVRDQVFIRPVLCLTRSEIEEYCLSEVLKPRIDESNLEEIYSRNKIRLKAIPFIEENFNKDIISTLNRLAYTCSKDVELIENIINGKYPIYCKYQGEELIIKKEAFSEIEAIVTRVIKRALVDISSICNNFEMKHIYDIIALQKSDTGKRINITNGVVAVNEYGHIKLKLRDKIVEKTTEEINFNTKEKLELNKQITVNSEKFGKFIFELSEAKKGIKFPKDEFIKVFDFDKVSQVIIRGRKDGDKITPLGMKGSKKIKDILMDAKVPKDMRDSIPLILFDNEVAWITGLRVSDKFKVTKNTKVFLKIKFVRKED